MLEGPTAAVQALYAKTRQDPRHHHVVTLQEATLPQYFFLDWQMALVGSEPLEMYWLIPSIDAQAQRLLLPRVPITDPQLLTLFAAFRRV